MSYYANIIVRSLNRPVGTGGSDDESGPGEDSDDTYFPTVHVEAQHVRPGTRVTPPPVNKRRRPSILSFSVFSSSRRLLRRFLLARTRTEDVVEPKRKKGGVDYCYALFDGLPPSSPSPATSYTATDGRPAPVRAVSCRAMVGVGIVVVP
jgi:hypothetical protein